MVSSFVEKEFKVILRFSCYFFHPSVSHALLPQLWFHLLVYCEILFKCLISSNFCYTNRPFLRYLLSAHCLTVVYYKSQFASVMMALCSGAIQFSQEAKMSARSNQVTPDTAPCRHHNSKWLDNRLLDGATYCALKSWKGKGLFFKSRSWHC